MAAPQLFKLAGRIASRMADKSADSGLARIEKIFGTPPRVPSPTTIEKIARSDEAFARGPVEYSRYRGPMEDVDEVIIDAPLSRSERDYFANISKMKENYFGDMSFDIPPNKRDLSIKSNVRWLLRNLGVRNKNHPDYKETIQDLKDLLKDVKEFKHGGGLSDIGEKVIYRQGGGSGEPRTIAEAKSMGKNYFINKHGTKLAAVTKEELDKSGLSLGDYLNKQNKFNKLMRSITPGLKPTQDLPTPIQEKLGKGIKERDYRIINPLLDKRIKYSQQQDINNPPSDQPTSVSQQMDTMREKIDRGRQEVDMRREMNKWINMGFVPSVHGSGADVAFDPVTGGSFVTIDDQAIDTTSAFKHGGGLSSVNKPITINGQPHSLAWIRPDEASVLKAMGGSGKKVDGIPAYFDAYSMGETPLAEELYSVPEPETAADVEQFIQDRERLTAKDYAHLPEAFTYAEKDDPDSYWNKSSDDPTEYQKLYDRPELNTVKTQLIERLGGPGMEKYMKGLGTSGLRNVINKFHTGWDFGGAMGTVEGISRDMATVHASKLGLKEYMKRLKDLEGEELSDEKREERLAEIYSDLSKTARDTGGVFTKRKKFTGVMADFDKQAKGVGLNPLVAKILKHGMPGTGITKLIAGAGNTLADLAGVIGEYTTEAGKKFSVRKDGSLVEADMPPDPSSVDPGTVEVAETVEAVAPTPEVVVAEAGPMETYQTGLQSIESNEGINNSIQILMDQYGISESEARRMLGENVNIA